MVPCVVEKVSKYQVWMCFIVALLHYGHLNVPQMDNNVYMYVWVVRVILLQFVFHFSLGTCIKIGILFDLETH